jgi:hypothetical protein
LWHQIQASQTPSDHPLWMAYYFNPIMWGEIYSQMGKNGFTGIRPIYVYKQNMNYAGQSGWLSSVEPVLQGFRPNMDAFMFPDIADPTKRHNLFAVDSPLQSKFKTSDGKVLNNTQKSPAVMEKLANAHSKPFGNALVVCAGAGGEVMGFIRARQNVVAVERDLTMFKGLCQHMKEFQEVMEAEAAAKSKAVFVRRLPKPPVVVPAAPVAEEEVAVPAAPQSVEPAPADVPADKAAAPPVSEEAPAEEEKKAAE